MKHQRNENEAMARETERERVREKQSGREGMKQKGKRYS